MLMIPSGSWELAGFMGCYSTREVLQQGISNIQPNGSGKNLKTHGNPSLVHLPSLQSAAAQEFLKSALLINVGACALSDHQFEEHVGFSVLFGKCETAL